MTAAARERETRCPMARCRALCRGPGKALRHHAKGPAPPCAQGGASSRRRWRCSSSSGCACPSCTTWRCSGCARTRLRRRRSWASPTTWTLGCRCTHAIHPSSASRLCDRAEQQCCPLLTLADVLMFFLRNSAIFMRLRPILTGICGQIVTGLAKGQSARSGSVQGSSAADSADASHIRLGVAWQVGDLQCASLCHNTKALASCTERNALADSA